MKRLIAQAEDGIAEAQFNLGVVYANPVDDNGHGIDASRAEAIKWLRRAADQGLPRAQMKLAEIYAEAPDASGEQVRACAWFLLAAESSIPGPRERAQFGYQRISSRLSPAQLATARRLARVWRPKGQAAGLPAQLSAKGAS
jgi:TPR repeat protein